MNDKGLLTMYVDCYFQREGQDKFSSWDDIAKTLAGQGAGNLRLIGESLQDLIDRGTVSHVEGKGYAPVKYIAALKKNNSEIARATLSRELFDAMNPQAKMDYINSGGIVA